MKTYICVIVILIVLFAVICFVGYKLGTDDQRYERDTGRDFASNRDKDRGFGGGYYGGGHDGGYHGSPRTRSYDDEESIGEEEEVDFGSDMDFPEDEREPEF